MGLSCLLLLLIKVASSTNNENQGHSDNSSSAQEFVNSSSAYVTNAMNVMNAVVQLSQSIKSTPEVFEAADQIMPKIETLENYETVLSVVGVVYSLVESFQKQQQAEMENYLQEIGLWIDIMLQDMEDEFQKVFSEIGRAHV
eukprot:TRINITY_DN4844_c0_g1_i1.p1 TRINITY_DN4844_c0_g1~~TRINITY_DN4844_c0_g1_i1.p1  ORF type:complete len:142 (+),score=19.00 TRINITY_DN4844_c0_g1_i1:87-512(+)